MIFLYGVCRKCISSKAISAYIVIIRSWPYRCYARVCDHDRIRDHFRYPFLLNVTNHYFAREHYRDLGRTVTMTVSVSIFVTMTNTVAVTMTMTVSNNINVIVKLTLTVDVIFTVNVLYFRFFCPLNITSLNETEKR